MAAVPSMTTTVRCSRSMLSSEKVSDVRHFTSILQYEYSTHTCGPGNLNQLPTVHKLKFYGYVQFYCAAAVDSVIDVSRVERLCNIYLVCRI